MCWNPDISINTFLFSCFGLLFIFLANNFTKYKTNTFDNPFVYLFLFEVATIQLIEFFLWRNLKNKSMNESLSKLASFFVSIQPFTLMLMIQNSNIRYFVLVIYLMFLFFYLTYKAKYHPIVFNTVVGKNGHLSWEWMNYTNYGNIWLFIYLFFYILPLFFIDNYLLSFFLIITLSISFINYFRYNQ